MGTSGCVVYEEKSGGGKALEQKNISFNIYLHSALVRGRNSKWVTVSKDSRKKRKNNRESRGEKQKLRESQWWTKANQQFTGLKCAAANL